MEFKHLIRVGEIKNLKSHLRNEIRKSVRARAKIAKRTLEMERYEGKCCEALAMLHQRQREVCKHPARGRVKQPMGDYVIERCRFCNKHLGSTPR